MANVSDDLLWSLVRSNTCFLYKRNGQTRRHLIVFRYSHDVKKAFSGRCKRSGKVVLTAEPNNLMNKNSYKFSGLANSKAVGIEFANDSEGRPCAAMCLKSSKKRNKPKKSVGKSIIKKSFPSVCQAIEKQTRGTHYRPDLENAALVRWSKVHRALRVKKGEMKPMTISSGRKSQKSA